MTTASTSAREPSAARKRRWLRVTAMAVPLVLIGGALVFWFGVLDPVGRGLFGYMAWRHVSSHAGTTGYADLRGGVRLYHEVHGAGDPVVVLHGGFGAVEIMFAQIEALSEHYRVIAIDSRAHGRSTDRGGALHYSDMADDVVGLLDHLHVRRAHVVGWSDGGILALDLGIRHPDRVATLVAIGANATPDGLTDEFVAFVRDSRADSPELADIRGFYEMIAPDPTRFGDLAQRLRRLYLSEPRMTPADLARIESPTLLLVAAHDAIRPEHSRMIARSIPRARLETIAGATHAAPLETPDEVNRRVLAFLARHPLAERAQRR